MATQYPPNNLVESIYVKNLNTPPRVIYQSEAPGTIYKHYNVYDSYPLINTVPINHPYGNTTPYLSRFHEKSLILDKEFQNLRLEVDNEHRSKVENLL